MISLPGGLWRNGTRYRRASFKHVDGHAEMALAEVCMTAQVQPVKVTRLLHLSIETIGEHHPSREDIQALSVADRQYLARQLARVLNQDRVWLKGDCARCSSLFDFAVNQSTLPVKTASDGYPFAVATLSCGVVRVRVPTGKDQEAISGIEDDDEARNVLLERCIEWHSEGVATDIDSLNAISEDDKDLLENAIESVAPEVAVYAEVECPECGASNEVYVDPYLVFNGNLSNVYAEIDSLARTYHWSEGNILALSRHRRKLYLKLVDRFRELHS